jgi:hypothetical protein
LIAKDLSGWQTWSFLLQERAGYLNEWKDKLREQNHRCSDEWAAALLPYPIAQRNGDSATSTVLDAMREWSFCSETENKVIYREHLPRLSHWDILHIQMAACFCDTIPLCAFRQGRIASS